MHSLQQQSMLFLGGSQLDFQREIHTIIEEYFQYKKIPKVAIPPRSEETGLPCDEGVNSSIKGKSTTNNGAIKQVIGA